MDTQETPLSKTILLTTPIERGALKIAEVVLIYPNGDLLEDLQLALLHLGDVDSHLKLIPRISVPTVTVHELERLDAGDLSDLVEAVVGFLNEPQVPQDSKRPNGVIFSRAIERDGKTIDSVELRKPQAGELRGLRLGMLQVGDVTSHRALLQRISSPRLKEDDLRQMGASDLFLLTDKVVGFLLTSSARKQLPT